jgi:nicotinate dehydrogenase subunit B
MAASDSGKSGSLSIVRPAGAGNAGTFETFIRITAEGSVTAFNGHVDLGTGIRTALGQIVAEELDVSFARVVVGDTTQTPNQGATIASETIQITAVPLRKAAAQARHFLVARAAERLGLPVEDLTVEDGLIRGKNNRSVSYGELIAGETIRLELADDVPVKAAGAYSIVGHSQPRVDLPSMSMTCACRACCMAAWSGRPMPASMPVPLSARVCSPSTRRRCGIFRVS